MSTSKNKKTGYESSLVRRIIRTYLIAMLCVNAMLLVAFCYVNLNRIYTDELIDMARRVEEQFESVMDENAVMENFFNNSRNEYFQQQLDDLNKYSRPEKIHLYVVFPNGITSRYDEDQERVTFEVLPPEFFPVYQRTLRKGAMTTEWPGLGNRFARWTVAMPIHGLGDYSGGMVIASINTTDVLVSLMPVFFVIALSLALSFFFLLWAQRGFAKILEAPLNRITEALKNWSLTGYTATEEAGRVDEIGRLARAIDELALTLEEEQACRDEDDANRRTFFNNISHELRTPVTALRAEVELLRDGMADEEELPGYYESLYQSTLYLQNLVDDLLTLSRLQAPGFVIEKDPCCFADILEDVRQGLTPAAAEKGVRLEFEQCVKPDQTVVLGNYARLRQLVTIFVDNAVKYSEAGTCVSVTLRRDEGKLRLTVRDQGMGIPEEEIAKVFDRQYRASNARDKKGSGLGLAIARELTELLGFELSLDSRLNEGTTVELIMPCQAQGTGQ